MASITSPYLDAIQQIDGRTPGEKYHVLNRVAAKVVASAKTGDIDPLVEIKSSPTVPDLLVPLVHAEVSKELRHTEGIITSLKSDDPLVFKRALKAKWFFDGSNTNITNFEYYENYIFPHVSLNNRVLLVKKLALYLCSAVRDRTSIAEDFYTGLSGKYGRKFAEPLLIACSELFIKKLIVDERRVTLKNRSIEVIYKKYPNTVVEYLKLSKPNDREPRNVARVDIYQYTNFLPRLLKKNINSFIELLAMHNSSLDIQLSRTSCDLFMKLGFDALLRNPNVFLPVVGVKVTAKLSDSHFKILFKNLFPAKIDDFQFSTIYGYLEYYQGDKVGLLLSTFEEIYQVSLLADERRVTPGLLKVLPLDERVKQARKKLEKDRDWHLGGNWNFDKSWRCYLSTVESVPLIKQEISKRSVVNDRRDLLELLIFTCSVNNDKGALLEVLKYISTRHKNEQGWMLLEVLGRVLEDFKAQDLDIEHWELLNNSIQLLHVKNELMSRDSDASTIIVGAIHFNLINNLPIDDKASLYIEINSKIYSAQWNILRDHPEYEKKCLDAFLTIIPEKYPLKEGVWYSWSTATCNLVDALYNFNTRNSKNSKSKLTNFSVKNYPWLLEIVKKIVNQKGDGDWAKSGLLVSLREGERDLYDAIVVDKPKEPLFDTKSTKLLILLQNHPEVINDNWEKYLASLQPHIYSKLVVRFMRSCRWHQELPIKFAEKSLRTFMTAKSHGSLRVLGLLYEGSSFERVINPFVPKNAAIDAKAAGAKSDYDRVSAISTALNVVTPSVSLDLILDFCVGDYVHTMINCLMNAGHRVSVDRVIPFTRRLMDKGVSIKKHGIRLVIAVAGINDIRIMLTNLLRNEKHRSIRAIVFDKILQVFTDEPTQETWAIVCEAIEDLRPDDDAIAAMADINRIPDEFIVDYVRLFLNAIRRLERGEHGLGKQALARFTQVINSVTHIAYVFGEELHQFILRDYFADLSKPDYALAPAVRYYVVSGYLQKAGDNLEMRLEFLSGLLIDMIKTYWNAECAEKPGVLLGNRMIHLLTQQIMSTTLEPPIGKAIVQSLSKTLFEILQPAHEPSAYLYLTYASIFEPTLSSREFAKRIGEILPTMIAALSKECLSTMASALYNFLNFRRGEWENTKLDVVESLLELNDVDSTILAAMLLFSRSKITGGPRFWRIVKRLREHQHPAVVANVYMCVNEFGAEQNGNCN